MRERFEILVVPLEPEEDDPLPTDGVPVDVNDPQLVTEQVDMDLDANAFATSVKLKIGMDMRGVMARSVSVQWW